jgi:hypothetical protein
MELPLLQFKKDVPVCNGQRIVEELPYSTSGCTGTISTV